MLVVGPLVTLTGAAPRTQSLAVRIELLHERRGDTAIGRRRIFGGVVLIFLEGPWTVEHPDVIVRLVDEDSADRTEDPIALELWPGSVDFECRYATGRLLRDQRPLNDRDADCNNHGEKADCATDLEI